MLASCEPYILCSAYYTSQGVTLEVLGRLPPLKLLARLPALGLPLSLPRPKFLERLPPFWVLAKPPLDVQSL